MVWESWVWGSHRVVEFLADQVPSIDGAGVCPLCPDSGDETRRTLPPAFAFALFVRRVLGSWQIVRKACFAQSSHATARRARPASPALVVGWSRSCRHRPRQEEPLAVRGITSRSSPSLSSGFLFWCSGASYCMTRLKMSIRSSPQHPYRTPLSR